MGASGEPPTCLPAPDAAPQNSTIPSSHRAFSSFSRLGCLLFFLREPFSIKPKISLSPFLRPPHVLPSVLGGLCKKRQALLTVAFLLPSSFLLFHGLFLFLLVSVPYCAISLCLIFYKRRLSLQCWPSNTQSLGLESGAPCHGASARPAAVISCVDGQQERPALLDHHLLGADELTRCMIPVLHVPS